MRRKILLFAAIAALAALPAFAQPPGPPPGPGGGPGHGAPGEFGDRMVERLSRLLELTEAQHQQLADLADQLQATVRPLHEQQRANRQQLRTLLEGTSPDPAAVGQLVIANEGLHDQVKAARQTFDQSFTAILTSEQRAAYETAKKLMFRDRRPGRRPGGPGGPGPR